MADEIEVVVTIPEPPPEPEPEPEPVIVEVSEPEPEPVPVFDIGVAVGQLRADLDALQTEMAELAETVTALAVVAVEDDVEPEWEEPAEHVDLSDVEFADDSPPPLTHWYNRPLSEWFS